MGFRAEGVPAGCVQFYTWVVARSQGPEHTDDGDGLPDQWYIGMMTCIALSHHVVSYCRFGRPTELGKAHFVPYFA